jgi:hypothetical protein
MVANNVTKVSLVGLALSASLFGAGCGAPRGMAYTVIIDTSMSADQTEDTLKGIDAWVAAVPGLKLSPVITPCHGTEDAEHTICVFVDHGTHENRDQVGFTVWDEKLGAAGDSATSHIWANTLSRSDVASWRYLFINTVMHELGHAMTHADRHIAAPGHLMTLGATDTKGPQAITSADVDFFWSAR